MKHTKKLVIGSISTMLLLGGCVSVENSKENTNSNSTETTEKDNQDERYVSVQDYTGEGYMPRNGEETDKIAKDHKDEISEAVQKFFIDTYRTEVKVHNVVGSQDAATVFVESVGVPHFYTYAVVPIDKKNNEVKLDRVFTQEGQVEDAIKGGLYYQIFKEEFAQLDNYIEELVSKGEVIGRTTESLENVGGVGFMTPYYFISTSIHDVALEKLYKTYMENPNIDINELKEVFESSNFEPKRLTISVQLYMSEKNEQPSEEIFNQLCKDIEVLQNIPKGSYSVTLNDNLIDKLTAIGIKDNSLEIIDPNYIVRE